MNRDDSPEQYELPERIDVTLGEHPYILLTSKPDPDSKAGFDLDVKAGGGIASYDEITCLLLLLVERLTGVSTNLYVTAVDVSRRAAGVAPLRGQPLTDSEAEGGPTHA